MDAVSIFPILLAFMITVLMALGYALHRLAKTSYSGNLPSVPALKCPQCQQAAMNWSHCPACGTALAHDTLPRPTTHRRSEASPDGIAHRS